MIDASSLAFHDIQVWIQTVHHSVLVGLNLRQSSIKRCPPNRAILRIAVRVFFVSKVDEKRKGIRDGQWIKQRGLTAKEDV